jgi:hypothetical protein
VTLEGVVEEDWVNAKGAVGKCWSDKEDAEIMALHLDGRTPEEIGKRLKLVVLVVTNTIERVTGMKLCPKGCNPERWAKQQAIEKANRAAVQQEVLPKRRSARAKERT